MTRKKGDYVCNLYCLCYEYRVFGYRPLSEPGLFLWKKDLEQSKEYFVRGCLKQDKVPGNGFYYTLDLETAFSFRGRSPLTPNGGVGPGPHRGPQKAPGPHGGPQEDPGAHRGPQKDPGPPLSGFLTFLPSHL